MPAELKTLLKNGHYPRVDCVCDDNSLLNVAKNLKEWRTAAFHLFSFDRSAVVLEDLKGTHFDDEGKRQLMLQKWADEEGTDATYGALATILLKVGQRSLAERLLRWSNEAYKEGEWLKFYDKQAPPL